MNESFKKKLKTIQESLNENEKVIIYKAVEHSPIRKCDKYAITKDNIDYIQSVNGQKGNVLEQYRKANVILKQRELDELNK